MSQYPNITWALFDAYNDNRTDAFETMCRRVFTAHFLKGQVPHSNHNNKGVEVMPILEPLRDDGKPQKRISFQAKYTTTTTSAYSKFKKSAMVTAKEYNGELDRVYLFCNQTLTTDTNAYQEIVKIHDAAGIETYPISNSELLDLVAKYRDIADYFFNPRKVADVPISAIQSNFHGISIDTVSNSIIISAEAFGLKPQNEDLLRQLVAEKIKTCRSYACSLELEALKAELNNLISYDIDGMEGAGEIYYYLVLVLLYKGNVDYEYLSKCANREEAEWIVSFFANPVELSVDQFLSHSNIAQVFIIDKLFTSQYWKNVVELCDGIRNVDPAISIQLDLHKGLSLLNLQEFARSKEILYDLYERTQKKRFEFYAVIADIHDHCAPYRECLNGNTDELSLLLNHLDDYKDLKEYKQQELIVGAITMESCYYLGITNKDYLETAIIRYDQFSYEVKSNEAVSFIFGLCVELDGDRKRASDIYAMLNWRSDPIITERYMICLILDNKPEKALAVYEELAEKTVQIEAIYLFALDRSGAEIYEDKLHEAVDKYRYNLEQIIQVAYYTDSEKKTKEIIVSVLKYLIELNQYQELSLYRKNQLIIVLAQYKEVELLEVILDSIENLKALSDFTIGEIYRAILFVANREYIKEDKIFQKPEDFVSAERIADHFLSTDIRRDRFLQVRMLCAGANQESISFLKYSKELFEYTHDESIARNIIAAQIERKSSNPVDYQKYLELLARTNNPEYCTVIAAAHRILGYEDGAEFYAYKAIYLLNGKIDYSVFRNYFNIVRKHLHSDSSIRTIKEKMIVVLQELDEETEKITIALDPETDFADETNHSFGIEHIHQTNLDYIKLRGTGIKQVINFRGKHYRVVEIYTRGQFGFKYITSIIQESPEEFNDVVWMVSTTDPNEFISRVRELTDNSDHVKAILSAYHFEENEVGLPIDSLISGDYGRYVDALKYLLQAPNEAFYAGESVYMDENGQKYVPTLSTFVLLAVLNRLDVLDKIMEDFIIPESYNSFFREQYSKALDESRSCRSVLIFEGDKAVMKEPDISISGIWESILSYIANIQIGYITDEERIEFKIADNLTGERMISGFRLSQIHLDALILARREKATYLCDDLFFRKIAAWLEIRNLNITSLIQHYNADYMMPLIIELSKTNYIYIPLKARTNAEAQEILKNVMCGEKKQYYYSDYIQRIQAAKEQALRKLFGNTFVDKMALKKY